MPQAGDLVRVSITADSAGLPTPALTGQGITWDYSALNAQSQTIDTFLSVSSTSIIYQVFFNDPILYPTYKATVAQSVPNAPSFGPVTVKGMIAYYKNEASNYEGVGFGATVNGIPTPVKDNSIDVVYNFPMNYGNSDSCHSSSSASIPSLGYYSQKQYRINYVQGWGTLITPFGTFSAMKVKTLLYTTDSLYLDTLHIGFSTPQTEEIEYKWLANGEHVPVLEIDETKGSRTRQYTYPDNARNHTGIASMDAVSNGVTVYPNPGGGNFVISLSPAELASGETGSQTIEIYNILGARVYDGILKESRYLSGQHDYQLNLSSQPAGVYLYRVIAESGSLIGQGKLVIEK